MQCILCPLVSKMSRQNLRESLHLHRTNGVDATSKRNETSLFISRQEIPYMTNTQMAHVDFLDQGCPNQ